MLRISSWLATSGKFCRAKALAMLWSSVHCIASAIASTPRQLLAVSCFSDRQKTHGQTHTHTHTRTHAHTHTHTHTHILWSVLLFSAGEGEAEGGTGEGHNCGGTTGCSQSGGKTLCLYVCVC